MSKIFRLFILSLCLLSLQLNCFAGNVLQQQDELKFIQKVSNDPLPTHYGKDYLIREDYYGYLNGKDSLYGEIVNTLDDMSKTNIPNKELNIKYLTLLKTKIETIVKLQNNSIDNNMRLNAARQKIIIDDEDYKKLIKEVKELINISNFGLFN